MNYSVKINGFRTKEQAIEFMNWYEGGGEQQFYDHLYCVEKDPKDGCDVDMLYKGNAGFYDDNGNEISFQVRSKST